MTVDPYLTCNKGANSPKEVQRSIHILANHFLPRINLQGSNLQTYPRAIQLEKKITPNTLFFETLISTPFISPQTENIILMLMYPWPFSPSSLTHFLFHNNAIHNDQAFQGLEFPSCEWVFQNQKRKSKPDVYPKGTYGYKLITKGDMAANWTTVAHYGQIQTTWSASWDCGVAWR